MKVVFLMTLLALPTASLADVGGVSPLRKALDDCFWDSAVSQIQSNRGADISLVAENAFISCASEERAIRLMASTSVGPTQVEAVIVGIRLQLKRQLQDIAKNPSAYLGGSK